MPWPTPQDYNEAVQSPGVVFADTQLKNAVAETTKLGLPKAITGNFACVYRFAGDKKEWAVRCFHRRYAGRRDRYVQISRALADLRLPYTVPFEYLDEGIRIRGKWYPILKMEWVRGLVLTSYVEKNLSKSKAMKALTSEWLKMVSALRDAGIAHGDFQHGNVLVVGGKIRLVDYDGMYVPALAGLRSNETGHPNYQHPHRTGSQFSPELDNFSAWAIYVSLVALTADPTLLGKTTRGDEALIFCKKDFEYPAQSRAFGLLKMCKDAGVRSLAKRFLEVARLPPSQAPPLDVLKAAKAPVKRVSKPVPEPALAQAPTAAPPGPAPKGAPAAAVRQAQAAARLSSPKSAVSLSGRTAAAPPKPGAKPAPGPAWLAAPPAVSPKPSPGPAPTAPTAPPGPAGKPPSGPWYVQPAAKPVPAAAPPRPKARSLGSSVLAGVWWLVKALAEAVFLLAKWLLVCLWWLLKALAWLVYLFCRTFLWRLPKRTFAAFAESYRKLPPPRQRRVQVAGVLIAVTLSAAACFWRDRLAEAVVEIASSVPAAGLGPASSRAPAEPDASGPEEEMCEFLASSAASLYIDGEPVPKEVPPPYRAALSAGEHTVRFVGPSGSSREITIVVEPGRAEGRPQQWFMDFADGEVRRRAPASTAE